MKSTPNVFWMATILNPKNVMPRRLWTCFRHSTSRLRHGTFTAFLALAAGYLLLEPGRVMSQSTQPPDWLWGRQSQSLNNWTEPWAVTTDAAGNAYVCGTYQGVVDIGTNHLIALAPSDMFVAKYGPDGTPHWARQGSATYTYFTNVTANAGYGVAVDAQGNTYVAGSFAGTNFPHGVYAIVSKGDADVSLVKYNTNGMLSSTWSRRAGGTGWDAAHALAIDRDGNLYLTGQFSSPTADFGANSIGTSGGVDLFVAKYTSSGDNLWVRAGGGPGNDMGYGITADDAGNVYVTGYFEGSASFGGRPAVAVGGRDVFLAKYDSAGNCLWVKSAGGAAHESAFAIAMPTSNRVSIAGYFQGDATFGTTTLLSPGVGHADLFVAEFDASGAFRWAKAGGGTSAYGRALAKDAAGHLYLTAILSGTAQFGGLPLTSSGPQDLALAMYDASGNVLWNRVGGNTNEYANALACDAAGNLITAGSFKGNAVFGPDALLNTKPLGIDFFIAKLGISAPVVLVPPQAVTTNEGATVQFAVQASGSAPLFLQWNKDDVEIGAATNAMLTLTNVQLSHAGLYRVTVSNLWGTDSAAAQLIVLGSDTNPPAITAHPASITTNTGVTVAFSVAATGTEPLHYQWFNNTVVLTNNARVSGVTGANLTLAALQSSDAGDYWVVVTNAFGAATSMVARLTVEVPSTCVPPPASLVGWWPGDGTGTNLITTNQATLKNGATYTPGCVGSAFRFDGTDDYAEIPHSPDLATPGSFTVMAWIRPTVPLSQQADWARFVDKYYLGTSTIGRRGWALFTSGKHSSGQGLLKFEVADGTGNSSAGWQEVVTTETNLAPVNQWTLIAGTYDLPTGRLSLYVNDTLRVQKAIGPYGAAQDSVSLKLGCGNASGNRFKGDLDEVALFQRALSSTEIATIYAAGTNGMCKDQIPPRVLIQPEDAMKWLGEAASFKVSASGSEPLAYQWFKASTPLTNTTRITGATGTNLTLADVQSAEAGDYWVKATNPFGSATSAVARLTVLVPGVCTPPSASLVGWWPGEGWAFDLIGDAHGANQGGIFYTNAHVGTGFTFDSNDDRVVIPHRDAFNVSAAGFTVHFWIKGIKNQPTPSDGTTLIEKSHGWADNTGWAIQLNPATGRPSFDLGSGSGFADAIGSVDVLDGRFHHVAATWVQGVLRLYVDSVLSGSATLTTPANNTRPVNLGFTWGGGTPRRFFRGQLDEVAVHNVALGSNQIAAIYAAGTAGMCKPPLKIVEQPQDVNTVAGVNATFNVRAIGDTPLAYHWFKGSLPLANSANISGVQSDMLSLSNLATNDAGGYFVVVTNHSGSATSRVAQLTIKNLTDGLVAYYPFGGDARDMTGHGNDGTVTGATLTTDRTGRANSAYAFNGTSAYINCATGPLINANYLTNFTLAAWIQVANVGDYRPIVSKHTVDGTPNGRAEFLVQVQKTSANLNAFLGDGTSGWYPPPQLNGGGLATYQWYHVAITVTNNQGFLYLNGRPAANGSFNPSVRLYGTLPLQIGRFYNGSQQFFSGKIDEVRVYNWALSAEMITNVMNALSPQPEVTWATIRDAWWSDPVDNDGDGYPREFQLNWDCNTTNSSLTVFEKLYYRTNGDPAWTLFATNGSHTISGMSTNDTGHAILRGDTHGAYDYRIEVYRSGQLAADATRDPSNDPDLGGHREETEAEDQSSAPAITVRPLSVTTNVGATVVFQVTATGTPPLVYQWLRDNTLLVNSSSVSGATSTNLVLANVQLADSGHAYRVVVSNAVQAVTSAPPALLTVTPAAGKPVILSQTLAVNTNVGAAVVLEVTADGAAPLTYQWFKGNQPLPTRTGRTCLFPAIQAADQGNYQVEVRNAHGPVRSAVIPVTLTLSPEPRWQWVETGGGPGDDEALDLWVARAGRQLWMAGYVQPGAEAGGVRSASFGGSDALLMRLFWDEGGMHFNTFTGGGEDDDRTVAVNRNATTLFQAGIFRSSAFAPGGTTITNEGGWDSYVSAAAANQQQWTLQIGSAGDEMCSGLACDQEGAVLVSGNLNEPTGAIFDWDGSLLTTNRGSWDAAVVKWPTGGNDLDWVRVVGGSGRDIAFGLAVDAQGNALLAGYTESTNATFGALPLSNHGSGDGFVAKYGAADGVVEWLQSIGGSGSEACYSVTTDEAGDAYVAGSFTSPSFTLGSVSLVNRGARNLFVARLRGSDGAVVWARAFGGSGVDISSALSVAFGTTGQLFVAGTITSADARFGSYTLNGATGDLFLAELNSTNGEPRWVTQALGQVDSLKIRADAVGNVYLAGSYQTNATFGPFARPNRGGKDLFVACYGFSPPTIWEQPRQVITNVGAVAQLSVRATSALPMTYQWRTNGVPIPGATNSTLVFASIRTNDTGLYDVLLSNPSGRTLSSNALVYVVPDGISSVQAAQRPDTNVVEITYHLGGSTPCAVSLSASADGGVTWDVPIVSVWGDKGTAVRPGTARRVQWNVGRDLPGRAIANLLVRISACGFQTVAAPFTVNTVTVPSWKVRVWLDLDRNGKQDPGEQLDGAGIHYGGRTRAHSVDFVVDGDALRVNEPLRFGAPLFVRVRMVKRAAKPGHEAVDNAMFSAWYDNDLGPEDGAPGTGEWRSYTVTSADIARAAAGTPIEVQLRHCVIEWNLVMASEVSSPDFLDRFKAGLESASRILYDVTDGQMKLGQVAIYPGVTQTSSNWRNADVVVYSRIEDQSRYQNGAIFWAWRGGIWQPGPEYHIYLGAHARGQPPDSLKYSYGFVHEFGHYALRFLDEYLDGNENQAAWQIYQQEHPDRVPRDFGLMDAAGAYTPEMSSYNDYLPSYSGPIASNDVPGRAAVSFQLYGYWLAFSNRWSPCWQFLEDSFEYIGKNAGLNIVVPPHGRYLGHEKRSQSPRQGPYSIPAPYVPAEFTTVQPFSLIATKSTDRAGNRVPQGPAQIRATWRGAPAIGAQVIRVPAGQDRLIALGVTDRIGQLSVYDLAPGDDLVTRWRGMESRLTVPSPLDRSRPIEVGLDQERPDGVLGPRDGSDPFGILVLPSISGPTNHLLSLTVRTAGPLIAPPSVKVYPDDATGAVVAMGGSAPNTYTGAVAVAEATGGTVEVNCEPVAGERLAAADLFTLTTVVPTNAVMLRARDGWAEFHLDPGAVTTDQPGLVYSSHAPGLSVPGPTKRQVGPVLTAALGSGLALNGTRATVNVFYRDSALLGLDETTLAFYRWDDALSQWQLMPSVAAISSDVLSASLTELGTFALFAEPSDDTTPPGAINDLRAASGTNGWNIRLEWTAPGDDGNQGTAATYVLRFNTAEITASNVEQAVVVPITQKPQTAGTAEHFEIAMPAPGVDYFFALQALDEAGNPGPLSTAAAARSYQEDSDGDGMADQWEATHQFNSADPTDADRDADGDGLNNRLESQLRTNPNCWDTDGDGMGDLWEHQHGLNPRSADDRDTDAEGDGLFNQQEYDAGTDPNHPDSDGDGLPDQWEVANSLCAFSAEGDNGAEGDPDHDGRANRQEYEQATSPAVADGIRIATARFLADGRFELAVLGQLGQSYTLEASTNLTEWHAITRFTCTNSPTLVTDTSTAGMNRKFYRVVSLPAATPQIRLQLLSVPLPDTGAELSLSGPVGLAYRVETSTNLTDWSTLTNFVSVLPTTVVETIATTNSTRSFFRAVVE